MLPKVTEYIAAGVDTYVGDPRGTGRLIVKSFSDAGIVGDAGSCQAFSQIASTGASAVAAAYSGGTAAGMAKAVGGKVMSDACAEQFPSPASGVEEAKQAYMNNAPSVPPEILNAQIQAGVRIVELQTQSKIEEAKILAKSALDVETTKQEGETKRAILQSKTLLKMTEMNNAKELEVARINLEGIKDTNATNLGIAQNTNAANVKIEQIKGNSGTIQAGIGAGAQVLTALINKPRQPKEPSQNVQAQPQQVAVAPTDPVDTLFREWGWQKVSCSPGLVFIKGLSVDAVCVNPTSAIPAGEYFYNSSNRQLEPVAVTPSAPQINHSAAPEEKNESVEENDDTTQEEGEDQ
jgi:hypothetical protein